MDDKKYIDDPRYAKYADALAALDARPDDDWSGATFLGEEPIFDAAPVKPRVESKGSRPTPSEVPPTPSSNAGAQNPPKPSPKSDKKTAPQTAAESDEDATARNYHEILERGTQGDVSVVPELERLFRQDPKLIDKFGDLAFYATGEMLSIVFPKEYPARIAIAQKMVQLRAELEEPGTTALERLLICRVSICWLDVSLCEISAANYLRSMAETAPSCAAIQRRLTAASNRFKAAVRTLAQTKKMLRPPVSRVEVQVTSSPKEDPMPASVKERANGCGELNSLYSVGMAK